MISGLWGQFSGIGLPAGLESVMYNIANLTIQIFVNELGTDTVAAWGTMGKIDAVFWMVCNAFAISITTFVGQNYGAGKYHRMRKSVRVCMVMAYISAFIVSGALILFANPIYHLFTTDQVVVDIGGAYDPFPDSVLCYLCCDRNSFRSAAWCRKSTGSYDFDLWRSLSFTYHLVVCFCKISSGDRQYHAQLSGVLDNYCGTVCHLLFSAISRYAEKEITIYEKVLILCNSSDQHLCFVRKMSIYYV